jgi:hypothetical protein
MLERILPPLGAFGILLFAEFFEQDSSRSVRFVGVFTLTWRYSSPGLAAPEILHAFAPQLEDLIGLRAFGDFDADVAIDGRDTSIVVPKAQSTKLSGTSMWMSLPSRLKDIARLDLNFDIEIAIGSAIHAALAFARNADLLTRGDAGGNIDIQVFVDAVIAAATADMAAFAGRFCPCHGSAGTALRFPSRRRSSAGADGHSRTPPQSGQVSISSGVGAPVPWQLLQGSS